MRSPLSHIVLKCGCGRIVRKSAGELSPRLSETPNIFNVLSLASKFRCSDCGEKELQIFDDKDRLLYDPTQAHLCQACGTPIPLPRIAAMPEAQLCTPCVEEGNKPPPIPAHPEPPAGKETCPRCSARTVMNQNSKDKSWFLGCSTFPRCQWTASI